MGTDISARLNATFQERAPAEPFRSLRSGVHVHSNSVDRYIFRAFADRDAFDLWRLNHEVQQKNCMGNHRGSTFVCLWKQNVIRVRDAHPGAFAYDDRTAAYAVHLSDGSSRICVTFHLQDDMAKRVTFWSDLPRQLRPRVLKKRSAALKKRRAA